ncbi:protein phosphatase 2C domain-containing protein [bacterium]|nr:protein phosphatase 2C domain-containing protein [bacterium]MBQ4438165.1 protein phosphatase 2C domain-containing protein [bacterium]
MKFLSMSLTDKGLVRKNNEDHLLEMPELGLFAIADGMGGELCGEVASEIAVNTLRDFVTENRAVIDAFQMNSSAENKVQVLDMLADALRNANAKVFKEADKRDINGKMGTTLTALLVIDSSGFMVHTGDSRLYMIRQSEITQLSTDHTLINDYKKQFGDYSGVFDAKFSGILTKAIGIQEYVEPEKLTFAILPEDKYLLCSDGLYNGLECDTPDFGGIFDAPFEDSQKEKERLKEAMRNLTDIVYKNGAPDNVSMILVSAFSTDEEEVTGTREFIKKFDKIRSMELFKDLEYKELLAVMAQVEIRTYNKYDVISKMSAADRELFIILDGKVSALKGTKLLKTFRSGDHIGDVAFLSGEIPTYNLFLDKTSSFLVIKKSAFDKIVAEEPIIGVKLLTQLATVLAKQTNIAAGLINEQ